MGCLISTEPSTEMMSYSEKSHQRKINSERKIKSSFS